MIEMLLKNAKGTFLKINVKEIVVSDDRFKSLMYTIQGE
jgi:hypothetical protein